MRKTLQELIDGINNMIEELRLMKITIDDFDNPNDWRLAHIEWDKEADRVWFRTEEL